MTDIIPYIDRKETSKIMRTLKIIAFTAVFTILTALFCTTVSAESVIAKSKYDSMTNYLTDSDGNTYCIAYNNGSAGTCYVVCVDKKGKVTASSKLDSGWMNIKMKELDDNIYVTYSTVKNYKADKAKCKIYDKSLNLQDTYTLSYVPIKDTQFYDVNSSKVVYISGRKSIYMCDHNGKNKKKLLSADEINADMIQYVALNGNYAAFSASAGVYGKEKYYYGLINIKTGKIYLKKTISEKAPEVSNDLIAWYNTNFKFPNKGTGSIIMLKDGKFFKTRTETYNESNYIMGTIDSEGKIITYEASEEYGAHKIVVRIYDDRKCINKFDVEISHSQSILGTVNFTADGGVIAFSYSDNKDGSEVAKTMLIEY